MPQIVHPILVILAFCVFVLAAWEYGSPHFNRLIAVGLALGTLALLI